MKNGLGRRLLSLFAICAILMILFVLSSCTPPVPETHHDVRSDILQPGTITAAPASAMPKAIALPIPLLPPVIRATFPGSRNLSRNCPFFIALLPLPDIDLASLAVASIGRVPGPYQPGIWLFSCVIRSHTPDSGRSFP